MKNERSAVEAIGYAIELKMLKYTKEKKSLATFMDERTHYFGGLSVERAEVIWNFLSEELTQMRK